VKLLEKRRLAELTLIREGRKREKFEGKEREKEIKKKVVRVAIG